LWNRELLAWAAEVHASIDCLLAKLPGKNENILTVSDEIACPCCRTAMTMMIGEDSNAVQRSDGVVRANGLVRCFARTDRRTAGKHSDISFGEKPDLRTYPLSAGPASGEQTAEQWLTS
jgi:hypothetical protein